MKHPELFFATNLIVDAAAFMFLLIWGIVTSPRMGIPSISQTMADSVALDSCYFALIFIAIIGRTAADVAQLRVFWEWPRLNMACVVSGILQGFFLQLVCLVTMDYNETSHYAVAGTAILLSIARESFMFIRRKKTRPPGVWTPWAVLVVLEMVVNLFLLTALVGLVIAYVVLINSAAHNYDALNVCLIEYVIFFEVIFLVAFQLGDFNPGYPSRRCSVKT